MTLVVEKNSAAHIYAVDNSVNYKLKSQGDEPGTTTTKPTTKPTEPSTKKTAVSVSVEKLPDKTSYYYKDAINTQGMQLEVIYSDGSSEIIRSGFKISPSVCTERGIQTVEVEYNGLTDTFNVNVSFAWWQWVIWILLLGFIWY